MVQLIKNFVSFFENMGDKFGDTDTPLPHVIDSVLMLTQSLAYFSCWFISIGWFIGLLPAEEQIIPTALATTALLVLVGTFLALMLDTIDSAIEYSTYGQNSLDMYEAINFMVGWSVVFQTFVYFPVVLFYVPFIITFWIGVFFAIVALMWGVMFLSRKTHQIKATLDGHKNGSDAHSNKHTT